MFIGQSSLGGMGLLRTRQSIHPWREIAVSLRWESPESRDVRLPDPLIWSPVIDGSVAPGFEPVREQFQRNFAQRGELGAAVAAYRGGEKVVDLWGGFRDAQ